jgi:hypothetical protein
MKKFCFFGLLILLSSCIQKPSIALKTHQFSVSPQKIIMLVVPGLSSDLLAQMSLSLNDPTNRAMERFSCSALNWEYDLVSLRPPVTEIIKNIVSGHVSSENHCAGYESKPLWNYFIPQEEITSVYLQQGSWKNDFYEEKSCPKYSQWWEKSYQFYLAPKAAEKFHWTVKSDYRQGASYADQTCKDNGECSTTISELAQHIYDKILLYKKRYVWLITDYSLAEAAQKSNAALLEKSLIQLSKLLTQLQNFASAKDALFILSAPSPVQIHFPEQGRVIEQYLKGKVKLTPSTTGLLGMTWAVGASAENLCGFYKQEELLSRLFWVNPEKALLIEK